ncbi:Glycosyl hydrolases family 28 [Halogranum rubrum]|uniref:Glycosyl hydrolases family 28 n=1 Tax=Halogranum rubrum TaxID=553466 RepID=A0A1I4GXJ7_9EURY|nr:glycoside hydrolase family 28 protein [Halogranum rubrum]SFL34270.1 Glycosyl hydrolases family 28 [Halogranum rubrum]
MSPPQRERSELVGDLEETFYDGEFATVPDREFDAAEFGAEGDGHTRCTESIQEAIDEIAAAGGGTVTLSDGTYLSGALFLNSDVELRIAESATLKAVTDESAYPSQQTRVAGIEMDWPAALLNVYGETNVRITGDGTIDGNGEHWWEKFADMRSEYEARGLRWAVDYDCERVRPVVVYDSTDVLLEGFTVERQGFWAVTMTYSDRLHVDGVTVRGNVGGYGPSTDGINTDSSRNVLVENCDIDGNDDCLCIKAGRDADGLRVGEPTENVVYRNCITREGGGLVTIGSETAGDVRNVDVYNIRGEGTNTGIRFKAAKVRGGVVEDVRFRNLEMDGVRTVFEWELDWHTDYSYPTVPDGVSEDERRPHWETLTTPVEPPERGIPEFRNVTVEHVRARETTDRAWDVNGYEERPIHDVRFEDVAIEAPSAGEIRHAENWTMENVTVRVEDGAQVELTDCQNVQLPEIERM